MNKVPKWIIWFVFIVAAVVPVVAASLSPLLEWRTPIYIGAGFAGILGLCVMLFQPMLAAGLLPGLSIKLSRQAHSRLGIALFALVILHIAGLWITSPPDVVDALLFASPTSFSVWGVIAMWCVIASVLLAIFRAKCRRHLGLWKISHKIIAAVAVIGTVVHALKIEGAMETTTKTALCVLVVVVTFWVLLNINERWKAYRLNQ